MHKYGIKITEDVAKYYTNETKLPSEVVVHNMSTQAL